MGSPSLPGGVAGADAPVHEEGDDGHDDAEHGEEHPVLADLGEGVLPHDGHDVGRARVAGAAPPLAVDLLDLATLLATTDLRWRRRQTPVNPSCAYVILYSVAIVVGVWVLFTSTQEFPIVTWTTGQLE